MGRCQNRVMDQVHLRSPPPIARHSPELGIDLVERNRFAVAGSNPCLVLKTSVRAARGTGRPILLDSLESTGR
jgi:hypothetical protein